MDALVTPSPARARFHPLRVSEIRRETAEGVSLVFALPHELRPAYAFRPGQYLTLRSTIDGTEQRRSYSICSGLDEFEQDGELAVGIRRVAGGLFSCFVHDTLRAGDLIDVMTPDGRFGASIEPGRPRFHLGIAAGSGITPILSIARSVLSREKQSRFLLVYGNRSTSSILFRTELEDLKDRHLGRLTVLHVLSRESQDLALLNGRIDGPRIRTLAARLFDPSAVDEAYVCGPGSMLDEVEATLLELGLPRAHVHVERFAAAMPPASSSPASLSGVSGSLAGVAPRPGPIAQATFILNGVTTTVPVQAGEALLDAGLRAGLDLPWSCRGGMCCTCRARLVEGSAVMEANFSLEPGEIASGFVLTCQARPTSSAICVDYDAL